MTRNNQAMRDYILAQIDRTPGLTVLDLGCGRGRDLLRLAEQRPDLKLFGLDKREESIRQAQSLTQAGHNIHFMVGDAGQGLPFPDRSFDVVYSLNFLECIADKQSLLKEVNRILKPGGQVVFAHFDWDSQTFDGEDKALVRQMVQAYSDWQQDWMDNSDAWTGRRLWRIFQASELFSGKIDTYVLTETTLTEGAYSAVMLEGFRTLARRGIVDSAKVARFEADLHKLQEKGQFFYSITMYIYVGRSKVEQESLCTVETLQPEHWPQVRQIYCEGIKTGMATLESTPPDWPQWDKSHLEVGRLVALVNGEVAGWVALSPVSGRCVYRGVAEVSIYIAAKWRGRGIGQALLREVIKQSEAAGIWTLQAGVFPENKASINLHVRCGFRLVGVREKIGQSADGRWRDVALLERRSRPIS